MFDHALVVGKFAPFHLGHQGLIDFASSLAHQVTVICWSTPDFPDMPNDVRAGWIRQANPRVQVLVGTNGPANVLPAQVQQAYVADLLARHGCQVDLVVTSEGYGPDLAAVLGADHMSFDVARRRHPISGTALRADVHGHRDDLHPFVYAHFVERVVFLGAESTGKTTLALRMADVFDTTWVSEYGRSYYESRGGELDLEDYVAIAHGHRRREDEAALSANRYVFVDTNAMTTLFFSHYYNRGSTSELRDLADACATRYRHVFVCDDDIAFEQDGWRDNVVWRARMQGMVLHDLAVRRIDHHVAHGTLEERVAQVCAVLDGADSRTTPSQRSSGNAALRRSIAATSEPKASSRTDPPRPGRSIDAPRCAPRHERSERTDTDGQSW